MNNWDFFKFILLIALIYVCDFLDEFLKIKDKVILQFLLRVIVVAIYFAVDFIDTKSF